MIFAIDAAPAAIPVKPKTAAISAITKNVNVQRSISVQLNGEKLLHAGLIMCLPSDFADQLPEMGNKLHNAR